MDGPAQRLPRSPFFFRDVVGWPQSLTLYRGLPSGVWPISRRTCSTPHDGHAKRPLFAWGDFCQSAMNESGMSFEHSRHFMTWKMAGGCVPIVTGV